MNERTVGSELLERPYAPPSLFIFEEVEIGGGYHTLGVVSGPESEWSEPYEKSSHAQYRYRVVRVPYPPPAPGLNLQEALDYAEQAERRAAEGTTGPSLVRSLASLLRTACSELAQVSGSNPKEG
ncbi:MAG TPA: hypothetical protein VII30_08260 [Gemmatimonadaceae bacterium]